jgi:hypothetical protein
MMEGSGDRAGLKNAGRKNEVLNLGVAGTMRP